MRHYTVIKAELELITPGFIGSADPHTPGIDPKSIKSALRQWWRALNSGHIPHQATPNQLADLKALHQTEMRLFGEEAKKDAQGQGMVQVVLRKVSAKTPGQTAPLPSTPPGITYLLGQGLYDHKAGVTRKALAPCAFTLDIILYHPKLPAPATDDVKQVLNALLAFGMLGGLGSRQNRGFGSVALRSLAITSQPENAPQISLPDIPTNADKYRALLSELFTSTTADLPVLTLLPAFSKEAHYRVIEPVNGQIEVPALKKDGQIQGKRQVKTSDEWSLLAAVGEQFMLERSWGHYDRDRKLHYTNGRMEAEQNYKSDHHLIKAALGDRNYPEESRNSIPQRSIYGLPYFFGKGVGMDLLLKDKANNDIKTRRGSPFHIHITRIGGQPLAVLYTLPSLFVPQNAKVTMGGKLRNRDADKVHFDYAVIERFLNRFTTVHKIPPDNLGKP